ncbi:BAR-domain-containing protein [Cystobasidium minutum MCA 4210]|uniref:BAR-domain-containing protein n=1 Tax=Cystobasidium minutum MCA 4210 TaxID=1397322 RepID=UPI0034CD5642|eukprot:jgi/Rhomi1/160577/estExt_Genewise1Plus.C_4_t20003
MKGITKAFQRAPHLVTSRVGMAKKSADPVTDQLVTRFAGLEDYTTKLVKDVTQFRDAVDKLLSSSNDFAIGFTTIFSPIGGESPYEFENKFPNAKATIQHIGEYQAAFDDLKDTIAPELELVDSRVVAPAKEFQEYVKKIRKTITKREHKLVDFDRHNNSYTKLREKKEKSLSDEKNLFKVEQDYEAASAEYEHYNNLLQAELPRFFEYATAFISPLFHSFYYMQLNIFYVMLEKLNAFAEQTGMNLKDAGDVEAIFLEKQAGAGDELQELSITKRGGMSTAQIMQQARVNQAAAGGSSAGLRSKAGSISSRTGTPGGSRFTPPISRHNSHSSAATSLSPESHAGSAASAPRVLAPPPYSPAGGAGAPLSSPGLSASGKRAPPPPPPLKPRPSAGPKPIYATALYDFQAQSDGDLSFQTGDRILVTEKSESTEDWWRGSLNGMTGMFPANYTQLDQ